MLHKLSDFVFNINMLRENLWAFGCVTERATEGNRTPIPFKWPNIFYKELLSEWVWGLGSWKSVRKCNIDYNTRNFKGSTEGYEESEREGKALGWDKEKELDVIDRLTQTYTSMISKDKEIALKECKYRK